MLERWADDATFKASLEWRPAGENGSNEYVFYDGPPFANGLPHYGHLLTGFVKDAVPRYQTMRGRRVERRFGWDCHGLPAEVEAERELGIAGHPAITAFGIDKFNAFCRTSVLRYTSEWERYVTRQARWVDFENDYKTLDLDYMESVMWAFKTLWEKGLIYEGFRVLAYCWRCETPLSNTETRMDDVYRDRQDPALTVWFELETRRTCAGVDHDTVDAAVQSGARRRARHRLRRDGGGRRAALRPRRSPARRVLPRAGGRQPGRHDQGLRARRSPLPAVVRFPGRHAERVPGARRRVRVDRGGHRCRPPRTGLRRGRPERVQRGRHPDDLSDGRARAVHGASDRLDRAARVRRQRRRDPAPQDRRRGRASRLLSTLVSALLALPAAARLPRDLVVVRGSHRVPRPDGRAQRADPLGARARQGRQLREVDRQRARLVDQQEPLLGVADPGVGERLARVPADRRVRLARRARGRLRRRRHRPPPAGDRRAGARQPRRPDRAVVDAPRATGARLLVRVGVDAVRPGALPVRERRVVRASLSRRLHRRVHRPDPRVVLHVARARDGAVRPAGVLELCEPRHRARRRRAQDVEVVEQLPRPDGDVRVVRRGCDAVEPALVADPARWRLRCHRGRRCATRSVTSSARSGTRGTS